MSPIRSLLILAALFGALYFVGLGTLSLVDYDEGAYAQVSKEMLDRGDLLRPSLNGEPWFEKPPLLYWSMAVGTKVLGPTPVGVRFLNATAAVAGPGRCVLRPRARAGGAVGWTRTRASLAKRTRCWLARRSRRHSTHRFARAFTTPGARATSSPG